MLPTKQLVGAGLLLLGLVLCIGGMLIGGHLLGAALIGCLFMLAGGILLTKGLLGL